VELYTMAESKNGNIKLPVQRMIVLIIADMAH